MSPHMSSKRSQCCIVQLLRPHQGPPYAFRPRCHPHRSGLPAQDVPARQARPRGAVAPGGRGGGRRQEAAQAGAGRLYPQQARLLRRGAAVRRSSSSWHEWTLINERTAACRSVGPMQRRPRLDLLSLCPTLSYLTARLAHLVHKPALVSPCSRFFTCNSMLALRCHGVSSRENDIVFQGTEQTNEAVLGPPFRQTESRASPSLASAVRSGSISKVDVNEKSTTHRVQRALANRPAVQQPSEDALDAQTCAVDEAHVSSRGCYLDAP